MKDNLNTMDLPPRSSPPDSHSSAVRQDESRIDLINAIRQLLARLMRWLFSPPYLPMELIWFLLAVIVLSVGMGFLLQKPGYWIDASLGVNFAIFGIPYSAGPVTVALALAGYMLLVVFIGLVINSKFAFAAWMILCLMHFQFFVIFWYLIYPRFLFLTGNSRWQWQAVIVAVEGVVWGIVLVYAAARGLFPWWRENQDSTQDSHRIWGRGISIAAGVCILLVSAGVAIAAFSPKPEWRLLHPDHVPPARQEAAVTYDSKRMRAVLFGGASSWSVENDWTVIDDTWEWDGLDWLRRAPALSPSPRRTAAMAFDDQRGVAVLFGGIVRIADGEDLFYNDTWEWNGETWANIVADGNPPARANAKMFFDPVRGKVVLFGGYQRIEGKDSFIFFDDVWEWNGQEWNPIPFKQPKDDGQNASVVYDPMRQAPMLMDGEGVWTWQDSAWLSLASPTTPQARMGSRLTFDPVQQKVVLFGGYRGETKFNETWTYDGIAWTRITTADIPSARTGQNLFFDPLRGNVLMYGGSISGTMFEDMWELVLR